MPEGLHAVLADDRQAGGLQRMLPDVPVDAGPAGLGAADVAPGDVLQLGLDLLVGHVLTGRPRFQSVERAGGLFPLGVIGGGPVVAYWIFRAAAVIR